MVSYHSDNEYGNERRPLDRARGDLLDSNVVAALLPRLQDENENVCRSALKCVTELAKHGKASHSYPQ